MVRTSDKQSNEIKRPVVLITDGSSGIGLALAEQFAQHGYDLVLVARNWRKLEQAADLLRDNFQCTVIPLSLDLTAEDAPDDLIGELHARDIEIDVLVNNAGLGDYGPFHRSDQDRITAMLRLNIIGLTALTRRFLSAMISRGKGRILNVASVVAFFAGGSNWASYVASKHYVLAFTRGLRSELAGTGVSITALCPGPASTEFADSSGVGASRVYRWLPKTSLSAVASTGYRATMAGRTTATPGLLNKLFAFFGELPPRGIAQAVFAFLSRGSKAVTTNGKMTR